ncbi:MAG: PAS domain-containing protein [Thiobacillaceae bacterium]
METTHPLLPCRWHMMLCPARPISPFHLYVTHAGLIEDCNSAAEAIFGYPGQWLRGRHVSLLLPRYEGIKLVNDGQIDPRLRFLCGCTTPFLARRRDGTRFASD